jgi:putative transposase
MDDAENLSHTKWECKYHVVFIPKYRRKALYGALRRYLGEVFRRLAAQKESRIEEGHLMPDHVHMMIAIPPKYAVSQVVGYIKGKSAIHLARVYAERQRNFVGQHFWARGVLRLHSGSGRSGDPGIHPSPGARRSALGADEPVEVMGHPRWPDEIGAALATPHSRFERLTSSKAPGSAGGWLLAPLAGCEDVRPLSVLACGRILKT